MDVTIIDILDCEIKNPHFKKLFDDALAKIPEKY